MGVLAGEASLVTELLAGLRAGARSLHSVGISQFWMDDCIYYHYNTGSLA
jgi:hypothetical protein